MKNKKNCKICGKESGARETCENCAYLLRKGVSEYTIRHMLADKASNKIWEEDKTLAKRLADAYYEHVIEEYQGMLDGESKENFGYNTFEDGINLALDINNAHARQALQR